MGFAEGSAKFTREVAGCGLFVSHVFQFFFGAWLVVCREGMKLKHYPGKRMKWDIGISDQAMTWGSASDFLVLCHALW
jgi:hypothetical protein